MLNYILPTIGFIILIIAIYMAIRNRYNTKKCFSCLMVGIFFSTLFMILPTEWVKPEDELFSKPLYSFISSLIFSILAKVNLPMSLLSRNSSDAAVSLRFRICRRRTCMEFSNIRWRSKVCGRYLG